MSAENLLKASITAEQLLVDVIADVVVWKSDTDGFDLPIFLENFELLTSKSKIWWLELHPHLLPTTPADIRVLASLLSQLDAEGVLFDNYGHFVGTAKGKNLEALINSLTDLLSKSSQIAGRKLQYFDIIAFHPETGLNISNADLIASLIN